MRHRRLTLGALLAGLPALMALVSLAWTPFDPTAIDIAAKLQPPGGRTGSAPIISAATSCRS